MDGGQTIPIVEKEREREEDVQKVRFKEISKNCSPRKSHAHELVSFSSFQKKFIYISFFAAASCSAGGIWAMLFLLLLVLVVVHSCGRTEEQQEASNKSGEHNFTKL